MPVAESISLPARVIAPLSASEARLAKAWWATLDGTTRGELRRAWAPLGSCGDPVLERGGASRGEGRLDLHVEAMAASGDDPDEPGWPLDLYEYLVNHEIFLNDGPAFHICSRHEAGKQASASARIPACFRCPLRAPGCPLEALGARFGRRAVRLLVRGRVLSAEGAIRFP